MSKFPDPAVATKFAAYPPTVRPSLMALRQIILDTAAETAGVGRIEETLKWGEPAYLTPHSGSGSTLRMDWKRSNPDEYALYFNCNTTLVDTFRTLFPNDFRFEGNRALLLRVGAPIPVDAVKFCVAAALTYHQSKPRNGKALTGQR